MMTQNASQRFIVPALIGAMCVAIGVVAGPLDPPPGAIAPTYKTLSEVEPRIAVSAANTPGDSLAVHRITQEGSYYLTGNVAGAAGKHSIVIAASNVTLDLNGYSIIGVTSSLNGILGGGDFSNIRIKNGTVRNHDGAGINCLGASYCIVQDVQARSNGQDGLMMGIRSVLSNVVASSNAQAGIALSSNSIAKDCITESNGHGFRQMSGNITLERCAARGNTGHGFDLVYGGTYTACSADFNASHGFNILGNANSLTECVADGNNSNGFYISGYDNVFNQCVARQNGRSTTKYSGFRSDAGGNHAYNECAAYYNGLHAFESAAVRVDYRDCVALENGGDGLRAPSSPVRVKGLRVESCQQRGIDVASGSLIEGAMIRECASDGIRINGNGNTTIRDCQVQNNAGIGAILGNGSVIENCLFSANANNGVTAGSLTVIRDCTFDNNGTSSGTTGHIYCTGNGNLIEGNYIYNGDPGIVVAAGGGTIVRRNIVNGTANNYGLIVGGNRVATVNTSATLSSTNPNDNFSY